jgi:hypothetical protein
MALGLWHFAYQRLKPISTLHLRYVAVGPCQFCGYLWLSPSIACVQFLVQHVVCVALGVES